jgi:hypothetical protein
MLPSKYIMTIRIWVKLQYLIKWVKTTALNDEEEEGSITVVNDWKAPIEDKDCNKK